MIAYVDVRRGVSGSSLLASLIDAGADADRIADRLSSLLDRPVKARPEDVVVDGLRSCRIEFDEDHARACDGPADLLTRLAGDALPSSVRERATTVYRRLAEAEGRAHGIEPRAVRFEELGSLRSVGGVLGTLLALEQLDVEVLASSRVPFGGGVADTHHGRLPLPAPATLELLRGLPVDPQTLPGELVTPTGAAILSSLAADFGEMPPMTIERVGIGSAPAAMTSVVTRLVLGTP